MANELYFMFENVGMLDNARTYFLGREHYVEDGEVVVYQNDDTEFSFGVEFFKETNELEELPEVTGPHINIRINYLRPENYVVEVAKELRDFKEKFSFVFFDEVKGEIAPFDVDLFEKEWRKANAAGLKNNHDKYDIFLKPRLLVHSCWLWNFNRRKMESNNGEEY